MPTDLFAHAQEERSQREAPLAARIRPRTLDEYIGQEHVVGPGRLLRRAIQADQLSSLIFCGPPGTGKTTLAMIIANTTHSRFESLNAVLAGVKDIRRVVADAQEARDLYGRRTILFVDEVHRWNKAQQDALLPWVENGSIILIGATIENPWFSVNRALLSRSRVFQLVPLEPVHLAEVARRALADAERGYGQRDVRVDQDALEHLIDVSNGDARSLLNALELSVETTPPDDKGTIHVDMEVAEESIQQRAVLYDREGDYHYDTISAFIKSVRGSDPDAALYWLARMVYAGEDPRFLFRRMLVSACEDIGLADPQALVVVQAAAEAFARVGLPEGQYHLAHAALYLATAPKSNSSLGYFDALSSVREQRSDDIPVHLKDASRDKEGFGHGEGYRYPHAYRDHWVAQQYLPDGLQGQVFYEPSDQGYEAGIRLDVRRRREAQLEAMAAPPNMSEVLTFSPEAQSQERWLMRAVSNVALGLAKLRDRALDEARIARHALVLDLSAGTGLFTWEALRRAPEGGVWSVARTHEEAEGLRQQAVALPELSRPHILCGSVADIASLLADEEDTLRFDAIVGHNVLVREANKGVVLAALSRLLAPRGRISLVEPVPAEGQRLYDLCEEGELDDALRAAWVDAEEAIYENQDDPMVNWGAQDLAGFVRDTGLCIVACTEETAANEYLVSERQMQEWFAPSDGPRPSYVEHLAQRLSDEDIRLVRDALQEHVVGRVLPWRHTLLYLVAEATELGQIHGNG